MTKTAELVEITFDGRLIRASAGCTVAAALANAGVAAIRRSVSGDPRGVFCAMGACQECRVTINGVAHRRACMTVVAPGMVVDGGPADD